MTPKPITLKELDKSKKCLKCKRYKFISDFRVYQQKDRPNISIRGICKLCESKLSVKRIKDNPEKRRGWAREYYLKNKEMFNDNSKNWYKKHLARVKEYQKSRNGTIETQVRNYTNKHYKKDIFCALCRTNKDLEFHHWRYRIPVLWGDFSTLCRPCHNLIHTGKIIEVQG
ncbi:MAG TPA: hypothetical protein V6C58_04630 [Allocoleopsis sp.]